MTNPLLKKFKDEKIWVNWKLLKVKGKATKIPYATTGRKASSTDPATWSTYEEAKEASANVGIIFRPDKLLLGCDIDHCLVDGEIVHEQADAITDFLIAADTYTEVSPSNTGLHIFLALDVPFDLVAHKKAPFELYNHGRYFTFTGEVFGSKVRDVRTITPDEATRLLAIIGYPWDKAPSTIVTQAPAPSICMDDATLIEKMFVSKHGKDIQALYNGDTSAYKNDVSSADMALVSHLAFWSGKNDAQIDRLWLASPLGAREKTQERDEYRVRTIAKAIGKCEEVYTPRLKNGEGVVVANNDFRQSLENSEDSKQTKAVIFKFAKYLIEKHHVKCLTGRNREIFIYKEGIYVAGEDTLKMEIRETLNDLCTTFHSKEIVEAIKDLTATDRGDFNVDINLINLNNGIFDTKNRELKPHNPQYLFFTKIPVNYNPTADCPVIKKYLSEVLEKEKISLIQEWFGYALYREYFIKKALICVGEGDTGKTTMINLLYSLLGDKNISGVSLQKMSSDKFAAANLYNKHINLYDDLSFKDIQDNGSFKIATGGGYISAEKKFGDQFQFKNYAKLTFACNKIPDVKDSNDEAYFNRWIVIEFNTVIEEENKDKQLGHKMATPEELSGLLNFALEGLDRLLKKQSFSYEKNTHETKSVMMRSGSSIARFAFDNLEEATGDWISKGDMYLAFKNYAHASGIPVTSVNTFGSRLPLCASYIAEFKPKDPKTGEQITAWRNVRIKTITTDGLEEAFEETEPISQTLIS